MTDSLMTVEDVAKYLKVEESTIYTWANQEKIPAIKISHFWRFKKGSIDQWLEEGSLHKTKGKKMEKNRKRVGEIESILAQHREELKERYKVKEIGIFGSYVRNEQRKKSDVDILVEFYKPIGLFAFMDLEEHLKKLLGLKVDLVSKRALKPRIGEYILNEVRYI